MIYKLTFKDITLEDTFSTRKDISIINTRKQNLFFYNIANKEYIKRSLVYSCPVIYNSLPDPVKLSINLATFKTSIYDFITTTDFP